MSRDQQILQAWVINLFKERFKEEKKGLRQNVGNFACLFRQTLQLVLYNIDLEMSQLYQSPVFLPVIFSVSYSI